MSSMPPAEDWIIPKAEIRNSSVHGRGLYATARIAAGEDVMVWGGPYVTAEQAARAQQQGKIIMQFDDDAFTVETEVNVKPTSSIIPATRTSG